MTSEGYEFTDTKNMTTIKLVSTLVEVIHMQSKAYNCTNKKKAHVHIIKYNIIIISTTLMTLQYLENDKVIALYLATDTKNIYFCPNSFLFDGRW